MTHNRLQRKSDLLLDVVAALLVERLQPKPHHEGRPTVDPDPVRRRPASPRRAASRPVTEPVPRRPEPERRASVSVERAEGRDHPGRGDSTRHKVRCRKDSEPGGSLRRSGPRPRGRHRPSTHHGGVFPCRGVGPCWMVHRAGWIRFEGVGGKGVSASSLMVPTPWCLSSTLHHGGTALVPVCAHAVLSGVALYGSVHPVFLYAIKCVRLVGSWAPRCHPSGWSGLPSPWCGRRLGWPWEASGSSWRLRARLRTAAHHGAYWMGTARCFARFASKRVEISARSAAARQTAQRTVKAPSGMRAPGSSPSRRGRL
ncbi:hypothetical protein UFOVP1382_92 [uncultured Caudovirales phage]|uniref:Uncharacterized protein n=1 Tax=uncultured Caudovirales phage TaxID=2100421 RepID=A0A6J5S542_9CAUD|nr:hypothetical protein UFOVP1382_92 [uncultured Caudovirales phage]